MSGKPKPFVAVDVPIDEIPLLKGTTLNCTFSKKELYQNQKKDSLASINVMKYATIEFHILPFYNGQKRTSDVNDEDLSTGTDPTLQKKLVKGLSNKVISLGGDLATEMTSPFIHFFIKLKPCEHISNSKDEVPQHDFDVEYIDDIEVMNCIKEKQTSFESQERMFGIEIQNVLTILSDTSYFAIAKAQKAHKTKCAKSFVISKFGTDHGDTSVKESYLQRLCTISKETPDVESLLFRNVWRKDIRMFSLFSSLGPYLRMHLSEKELDILFNELYPSGKFSKVLTRPLKDLMLQKIFILHEKSENLVSVIADYLAKGELGAKAEEIMRPYKLLQRDIAKFFAVRERRFKDAFFLKKIESCDYIEHIQSEISKYIAYFPTYKVKLQDFCIDESMKRMCFQRIELQSDDQIIKKFMTEAGQRVFMFEEYCFPFVYNTVTLPRIHRFLRTKIMPRAKLAGLGPDNTIAFSAHNKRALLFQQYFSNARSPIKCYFLTDRVDTHLCSNRRIYILDGASMMGTHEFAQFLNILRSFTSIENSFFVFIGAKTSFPCVPGRPFYDIYKYQSIATTDHVFDLSEDDIAEIEQSLKMGYNRGDRIITAFKVPHKIYKNFIDFDTDIALTSTETFGLCTPDAMIRDYINLLSANKKSMTHFKQIKLLLLKHSFFNERENNASPYEYLPPDLANVNDFEFTVNTRQLTSLIIIPEDFNALYLSKLALLAPNEIDIYFVTKEDVLHQMFGAMGEMPNHQRNFPRSNLFQVLMSDQISF